MLLWWYADRASAVLSYVVLVASVFTGIAYNASSFGFVHRWSRKIHTPVSWIAVVLLLVHGVLGTIDTVFVATGSSPAPGYGTPFLIAGAALGGGALVLTIVATLAFVDPKRFERPWKPGLVHAFAYGGFAFATIHAAAVGTDIRDFAVQGIAAIGFLLAITVIFRRRKTAVARTAPSGPTPAPGFRPQPQPRTFLAAPGPAPQHRNPPPFHSAVPSVHLHPTRPAGQAPPAPSVVPRPAGPPRPSTVPPARTFTPHPAPIRPSPPPKTGTEPAGPR